jgi:hypothetical protein
MGDYRLSVTFSESAYRTLEELARRKGTSLADVLRDALALEKWIQDEREAGGRVLIEREGTARELLVR